VTGLFAAGLLLAVCAIGWDAVVPIRLAAWRMVGYAFSAAAAGCLLVVGAVAVSGTTARIDVHHALALPAGSLVADRLSGLFLLIIFVVALPVALATMDWVRSPDRVRSRGMGIGFALTILAAAIVVSADNVFVLIFGWELLSFAFYLLAGVRRERAESARSSLLAFAFGKAGGALLMFGFLLALSHTGSWQLSDMSQASGALHDVSYVLLIAGFVTKCGLVPVQVWLPPTYESAPGPVRALMAGSAVNVAFYGLWRTLDTLGAPPVWLVVVVLLVAGFTAILGIAHAAVQTHLLRVIAYSSIENAGLIVVGYGVALAGAATANNRLIAVGLLAGTMQAAAHAIAKSLLFTSAATVEAVVGSDDLDRLRGVSRRLPLSGAGLAIGSLTLAGLPITIGFVSEWFLLEALMQQFRLPGLALKLAMAAAGALVALTAGFASVTFIRLFGFVVLGGRREPQPTSDEAGLLGRISISVLCLGCLGVAAVSPLELRVFAAGLHPIVARDTSLGALKGPWVLQPVFADFSILSPSWLWIAMPILLVGTALLGLGASRSGILRVRRVPAWRSATGGVAGDDQYTAFGYANPTRKVLANILLTRSELRAVEETTGGRVGQESKGVAGTQLGYTSDVVEMVGAFIYRPLFAVLQTVVRGVKRLQSGRLDAYVAYMLVAFVAVLAVVTALA
jgi:hydrogenase-4 component B